MNTGVGKVFTPANVCAPVVTAPPKEADAGCKFNTLPDIVAPLALGVEPMVDKELTPEAGISEIKAIVPSLLGYCHLWFPVNRE